MAVVAQSRKNIINKVSYSLRLKPSKIIEKTIAPTAKPLSVSREFASINPSWEVNLKLSGWKIMQLTNGITGAYTP